MDLIFGKNKKLVLTSEYISKIKTGLDNQNDGKRKRISFDDLRLFFLDESIVEYDTASDGFIHQFLSEQGYEVTYD